METLHIGVATRCLGRPLKRAIQIAAQIGVRAVQLDTGDEVKPAELSATGRREFLHHLNELGLSVASIRFPMRRRLDNQEQLDARLAALKEALEFATQLRAGIVTTQIGRVPEDPDSPQYRLLADILNDLAAHANRRGGILAVTPTNDSPESLAGLVRTVTTGPLGINFDPAAFLMNGYDPLQAWRSLHEFILHARIRDGIRDVDGTGQEVPVGRGEMEWDEFLALIDESGYRGWLIVDRTAGEDKANDAARAIQYLQRVARG